MRKRWIWEKQNNNNSKKLRDTFNLTEQFINHYAKPCFMASVVMVLGLWPRVLGIFSSFLICYPYITVLCIVVIQAFVIMWLSLCSRFWVL